MIRIFRVRVPASVLILFLADCLIVFACYTVIPYWTGGSDVFVLNEFLRWQIALAASIVLVGMYFARLYENLRLRSILEFAQKMMLILGMAFLSQVVIGYWDSDLLLPFDILSLGSTLTLLTIPLSRLLFRVAMQNEIGLRRLLFLGWSPTIAYLADYLRRHPELGFTPIGYLNREKQHDFPDARIPWLGSVHSLKELIDKYHPAWVIIANQEAIRGDWLEDFLDLRFAGIHSELAASFYETTLGRACVPEIGPDELVFSHSWRPGSLNLLVQSFYSKAIAVAAVAIALPVLAAIAILTKVRSRGPGLLTEQRVGLHGAQFTLYRLAWRGGSGGRAPALFHRFGLDMLPQFWNVLRGDLSIIGPDPDRPEFSDRMSELIPFYSQRNFVKPGMIGWARIHRSNDEPIYDALERFEYDLYYVKNLSPSLDFSVMLLWLREALSARA